MNLKIMIKVNNVRKEVEHLKANQAKVLVGVLINPLHNTKQIEMTHEEKLTECKRRLDMCSLQG